MQTEEEGYSFKALFVPFTTFKAFTLIAIIGLILFSNGLFNNFVRDDASQITDNQFVHTVANVPSFFLGSTFYNGSSHSLIGVYYKPLLSTVFSMLYTVFSNGYFAFHLFQLLIHIINTCILYLLFKRFFKISLAFILSLIFLVHPINSEAVFYISATQEVLFFLFGAFGLLILTSYQSKKSLILAQIFFLLSLFSKETGVLFLGIASIYKFIFNKKYLYLFLSSSAVTFSAYLLLRINAIGLSAAPLNAPIDRLDLWHRILNIPAITFFYIKTFFFPLDLASSYHWVYPTITLDHFVLPLIIDTLVLSGICIFGIFLYKKSLKYLKIYLFFTLWFLLGLSFHFQILPLDSTVSERWFYFPMVGILGMIGLFLEVFQFNLLNKKSLFIIVTILILLSTRTFIRSFDWRNNLTLATHDVRVSPEAYDIENIISSELLTLNRFEEAKNHAQRSIQLFPYSTNYNNLGLAYMALGNYKKAKDSFMHALQFGNYYYQTYDNLAILELVSNPDVHSTRIFLISSINKFPQDAKLWLYLAVLEYRVKNIEAAKKAVIQAYSYDQSAPYAYVYAHIMSNQPLNINFSY